MGTKDRVLGLQPGEGGPNLRRIDPAADMQNLGRDQPAEGMQIVEQTLLLTQSPSFTQSDFLRFVHHFRSA